MWDIFWNPFLLNLGGASLIAMGMYQLDQLNKKVAKLQEEVKEVQEKLA